MATKVIVCQFDSNGTGLTFAGSVATELGDSLFIHSTPNMEDLLFKTDKDNWTIYDVEEKTFSTTTDTNDTLDAKPVNYTAYDGGSTYSVGTLVKSEIFYQEGTSWFLFGSATYPSIATNPEITKQTAQGYAVKGIIFL